MLLVATHIDLQIIKHIWQSAGCGLIRKSGL